MGCASSVPARNDGPAVPSNKARPALNVTKQDHGTGEDGKDMQRSKTTRARRLSYITDGNTVQANTTPAESPRIPAVREITKSNSGTRVRRLSYITNEKQTTDLLRAEHSGGGADEGQQLTVGVQGDPNKVSDSSNRPVRVSVACVSRAGREPGFKKTNQDNCFAFEKYCSDDQSLFGAMDGHGPHGHLVSGYVKQHLPIMLVNHLSQESDIKTALTNGFVEVDKALATSRIDCEFSGSTTVVTLLKGRTLTTAWVGDSRGVMGRQQKDGRWVHVDLTCDHKPTNVDEKARILQANGRVERLVDELGQPMGPHRVWLQYAWIPGLAMSRALGDVLAHQVGVTSLPDHSVHELTPEDKFIILASDGVWEFITSKEAVELVAQFDTAEDACKQLVEEAYQRWLTEEDGVVDDITAVVVKFKHQ